MPAFAVDDYRTKQNGSMAIYPGKSLLTVVLFRMIYPIVSSRHAQVLLTSFL